MPQGQSAIGCRKCGDKAIRISNGAMFCPTCGTDRTPKPTSITKEGK